MSDIYIDLMRKPKQEALGYYRNREREAKQRERNTLNTHPLAQT